MVVKTLLNAVKGSKVPKGPKVKTYYKLKPDTDITQFKKSEKHSLGKKIGVWASRESGRIYSQAGSGVNIKYKKSGEPFVPRSEADKSALKKGATRVKGWTKITSPITGGLTGRYIYDKSKSKK